MPRSTIRPPGLLALYNFAFALAMLGFFAGPALAEDDKAKAASSLSGPLLTAAIAAVGWLIAYVFAGWRDDRTQRLKLTIERTSAQLSELYAPLVQLTEQLDTTASVQDEAMKEKSNEEIIAIGSLIYDKFFGPIHAEINEILRTKAHLLEAPVPKSFADYFAHYAYENAYRTLEQAGKNMEGMRLPGFPSDFYWDVRRGHDAIRLKYEAASGEFRHNAWPFKAKIAPAAIRPEFHK